MSIEIGTFAEARDAALTFLIEQGHRAVPEFRWDVLSTRPPEEWVTGLSAHGWHLDAAGFWHGNGSGSDKPCWYVRYWHDDDRTAAGNLSVDPDGRIGPCRTFFVGCLGLFTSGLVRIEADGTTTAVASDYDPAGKFSDPPDRRLDGWINQGWLADYGN